MKRAIKVFIYAFISLLTGLAGSFVQSSPPVKEIRNKLKNRTIAFPGAEGAGKFTKGGRGGDVYHVTTLKDSGPGSLREGIDSMKGPRTIVFDIGGLIRLKDELRIKDISHLTIAGQTAPGKGITVADRNVIVEDCSHIILRYLRIRLGDENKPEKFKSDVFTAEYSDHMILDHLSFSWGIDGNGDFRGLKYTTLQWMIFSEGLHNSLHVKGKGHAMCSSFRESEGPTTFHHNVYATSRNRHPSTSGGSQVMEFANNINYNWSGCHNLSGEQYNLINNYYKAGLMKGRRLPIRYKSKDLKPVSHGYFSGNYFDGLPEKYNKDNYTAIDLESDGPDGKYKNTTRNFYEVRKRTKIETAKEAYISCLKKSGCSLVRDSIDKRIIKSIINKTGKVIDSQNDVGGFDLYPSVVRLPGFDTDQDGMPDRWEKKVGLNPKDPSDGNKDHNNDGFTNLEEYINSLTHR